MHPKGRTISRMDPIILSLRRAAESGLIPPGSPVLLAVSGGADSMALFYGAIEASSETGWALSVGHVHHGWRAREADRDLAFVSGHARRVGLPFAFRRCDARAAARSLRLSPEAGARHVRYAALAEIAAETGVPLIATAHQRDDAVESHLIARERHGGVARLAGPKERRDDGVVRPLLSVTRKEVLGFLAARGIAFRRDSSNGDLRLHRNRIRRALCASGDGSHRAAAAAELDRCGEERRRLEREFAGRIAPALALGTDVSLADAAVLENCSLELRRLALARLAAAFARPGRPPMTGRERERLAELLGAGGDFRFEAGRHIRFERRGSRFSVRASPVSSDSAVYDATEQTSRSRESEGIGP
jgi:tRNA(Ile)-lysidine synthase